MATDNRPLFYPYLGARPDLGFIRISGVGIGNALFAYFHASVLARLHNGSVVHPPWVSIKPLRLLTSFSTDRSYIGLFRRHPDDVSGWRKILALARHRHAVFPAAGNPTINPDALNIVLCPDLSFGVLRYHRPFVRERLLAIAKTSIEPTWGGGGYIGVHIRLGDFAAAPTGIQPGAAVNTRVPMEWYLDTIRAARARWPGLDVMIFSDGSDQELSPLIDAKYTVRRSKSDLDDLFGLAGSSVLIGSRSTFSTWAAFLGDMPSVWPEGARGIEKPSSDATPWYFGDLDQPFA
ncbi:MAG: alpha-1,2-fucosyltransferase [Pseudomonadota bacterium]